MKISIPPNLQYVIPAQAGIQGPQRTEVFCVQGIGEIRRPKRLKMKIARVLCHPHSLVGDGAPTLWFPEEAIFKAMTLRIQRDNKNFTAPLSPTSACHR